MNIQWYPGHMTKARRMILENTKLIDAVCEVVDARIPYSSRNPDLDDMTPGKPRIIVLNRVDQADVSMTKKWVTSYRSSGVFVIETDSKSGKGVSSLHNAVRAILKQKIEDNIQKGQSGKKLRIMVVGIPNVGKSSFINRLAGRKAAQTSDRPGVTRGKQWISLGNEIELLDTPGVLWPKFEDQIIAENLAFTGAIRDAILDTQTLAANLMSRLSQYYPERLTERYKIPEDSQLSGYELLEFAAKKRGFLISGGDVDTERMAVILLDEFRGGKLGRITLEDETVAQLRR
ncbi:MAG: ribosome biogenesis GTPase YlqF [Oscillospiraceae bacterium]|nr:ribosome biogenesis GTPase YlqF [Oscillospiraceae bacterium]